MAKQGTQAFQGLSHSEVLIHNILLTYDMMGKKLSTEAALLILEHLDKYKTEDILKSLKICQVTCRGIYLVDILENLPKKRIVYT